MDIPFVPTQLRWSGVLRIDGAKGEVAPLPRLATRLKRAIGAQLAARAQERNEPQPELAWEEEFDLEGWSAILGPGGRVVVSVSPFQEDYIVAVESIRDLEPIHGPDSELRAQVARYQYPLPLVAAPLAFALGWYFGPAVNTELFALACCLLTGGIALFGFGPATDWWFGLSTLRWADIATEADLEAMVELVRRGLAELPDVKLDEG